jgi:hypothetical protein
MLLNVTQGLELGRILCHNLSNGKWVKLFILWDRQLRIFPITAQRVIASLGYMNLLLRAFHSLSFTMYKYNRPDFFFLFIVYGTDQDVNQSCTEQRNEVRNYVWPWKCYKNNFYIGGTVQSQLRQSHVVLDNVHVISEISIFIINFNHKDANTDMQIELTEEIRHVCVDRTFMTIKYKTQWTRTV